jgi:hypothetical protein
VDLSRVQRFTLLGLMAALVLWTCADWYLHRAERPLPAGWVFVDYSGTATRKGPAR